MTVPVTTLSQLMNDEDLKKEILEAFNDGALPIKDLGFEVRKRLPAKYRKPGNVGTLFRAINMLASELENEGQLVHNRRGTHLMRSGSIEPPQRPKAKSTRAGRQSRSQYVNRQPVLSH